VKEWQKQAGNMMTKGNTEMRALLLASGDGSHSGVSGYSTLARYLPAADFLNVFRQAPRSLLLRIPMALNRRLTLVRWAWGSSVKLEWMALQRLRRNPRQIVHYLWADRDMAYLDLLKRRMGFKLVGSFHNCPDQLENLFNFPRRLRQVDRFIVVSSCQTESLLQNGVPRDKISVVLHGVDTDHFRPQPGLRGGRFRVVSIGSWRRDFACMEEVFRRLGAQGDVDSVCLIEQRWRERWAGIPNLQLPDRVSDEELLRLYQSADVILMCVEASTANNALVEALACGLPVVGADLGGVKEYATDAAGLFFRKGDSVAALDALRRVKEDKGLAQRLSLGARARGEELDWRLVAAQIRKIYWQVCRAN
jgi:glycosyltransferase involved in cell wall biosynthesis